MPEPPKPTANCWAHPKVQVKIPPTCSLGLNAVSPPSTQDGVCRGVGSLRDVWLGLPGPCSPFLCGITRAWQRQHELPDARGWPVASSEGLGQSPIPAPTQESPHFPPLCGLCAPHAGTHLPFLNPTPAVSMGRTHLGTRMATMGPHDIALLRLSQRSPQHAPGLQQHRWVPTGTSPKGKHT